MSTRDWLELVAILIALGALLSGARSLELTRKTARAQFWLQLRELFARHDLVHKKLRPGGDWSRPDTGPDTAEDWAAIEAYMGLFEHCEVMLDQRLIDLATFRSVYSYRVRNLLANQRIVSAKLIVERQEWTLFHALVRRLGLQLPPAA